MERKPIFSPSPYLRLSPRDWMFPYILPKQLSSKAGSESFLSPQPYCFLQQWLFPFISNPESHYDPSPVAAPAPQTLGTALLLSFLDFPSEPSWHSSSKARWLSFWSINTSRLLTQSCLEAITPTCLVRRVPPQQAAWWDLTAVVMMGLAKLSNRKLATTQEWCYIMHLDHLGSMENTYWAPSKGCLKSYHCVNLFLQFNLVNGLAYFALKVDVAITYVKLAFR